MTYFWIEKRGEGLRLKAMSHEEVEDEVNHRAQYHPGEYQYKKPTGSLVKWLADLKPNHVIIIKGEIVAPTEVMKVSHFEIE